MKSCHLELKQVFIFWQVPPGLGKNEPQSLFIKPVLSKFLIVEILD